MANINIMCGVTESLEPVVNMYVKESNDGQGYLLTFDAKGAVGIAVDLIRQAAKAEIASTLYTRLQASGKFTDKEIDLLLEKVGD